MQSRIAILGAGMTGLAAGMASRHPVYEAEGTPGGICCSYYRRPGVRDREREAPEDDEAYRFEVGGGHWIFSGDPLVAHFIGSLTPTKSYARRSSVYFPDRNLFVPYPLQNHLRHLPHELTAQVLSEVAVAASQTQDAVTMADWMRASFGPTLCELFFEPFHERYTAGLWRSIAPQDGYKSPGGISAIVRGAFEETPPAGYNTQFLYPQDGLGTLAQRMGANADVHYGKRVVRIDTGRRNVDFADGGGLRYDALISTLPLNKMMELTALQSASTPDPYTSVLVVNIGAVRGSRCPGDHWIYVPESKAGFHRVGFYSNVDVSFVPRSARDRLDAVSLYVELAYRGGEKLDESGIAKACAQVVEELREWEWVKEDEVVDATWIDVAYTWSWPASRWRQEALALLEAQDIYQVGRYATWRFQGIAQSIRDGLAAGGAVARG